MTLNIIGLDLDGTILDSRYRHKKVLIDCLTHLGYPNILESLNDFISLKRSGISTLSYLQKKNYPNAELIADLWREKIENKEYLELDTIYPHVLKDLYALQNEFITYLVTARSNKDNTIEQIDKLGLSKLFKKIIVVDSGFTTEKQKYEATKHLLINYVIGDTEVDFYWANKLGAKFFALNCGFRNENWWTEKGLTSHSCLSEAILELKKGKI